MRLRVNPPPPPKSQQNYSISLTWNEHRDYFLVTYHDDMLWSGTQAADSGSGVGAFSLDGPLNGVMGSVADGADGVPQPLLRPSPSPRHPAVHDHSVIALAPVMLQSRSNPRSPQNKTFNRRHYGISTARVDHLITQGTVWRSCRVPFDNSFNFKFPAS